MLFQNSSRLLRRVFWRVLIIGSLSFANPAPAAGNPKGASYVSTPTDSRRKILEYCRTSCENNLSKPRHPYRATFEKALAGDFRALDTVFRNESYHTNDMEWDLIPWHILHVIGDGRYASFILSHPSSERAPFVALQDPYVVSVMQQTAFEGYFRKKFPRTYSLWTRY